MDEKREPLLSDKWIDTHELVKELARHDQEEAQACRSGMRIGRHFYESKITSGELMVVREVENTGGQFDHFICSGCKIEAFSDDDINFCPHCGAKIKTQD